jgi:fructose-1-phosphate kinase PfkB-like protein
MKAQKAKFGGKGLNVRITLMSLDNQVSAGIFGKNI